MPHRTLSGQERAFVFRLFNHRVGAVTSELREQVKALPLDKLEDLGEALLDFRFEADLQAWLRAHQRGRTSWTLGGG
jgi:hypothetical protein